MMIKKITYTIIIFNILFAVFAGSENLSAEVSATHISNDLEHKDIEHEDCKNAETHCAHECLGLHTVILTQESLSLYNQFLSESKKSWYYKNLYMPPLFEPSSRPPLYS